MITTIIPDNREHWLSLRMQDVTSTEIAALFGLSPYLTKFELWHRKKSQMASDFDPNERTIWGNRLESAIANGIAEDNGWIIRPAPEYVRDTELRMGSSFDFVVQIANVEIYPSYSSDGKVHGYGPLVDHEILEIKNVDGLVFRDNWEDDEELGLQAPPHIELQVQQQMLLKGLSVTNIGVLVGGNKRVQIRREADPEIQNMIIQAVKDFWKSIEENQEPPADFEKDSDFIKDLFSVAEPGKLLDARDNEELSVLAESYKSAQQSEKYFSEQKTAIKSQILMMIQDAEKVTGKGFSISAGMIGPAPISYMREAYRNFRINWSKVKKDGKEKTTEIS